MSAARVRARVLVSGRVQGVFFRGWTYERALELGVTGFVRNLGDGRVEAVFEGEECRVRSAVESVHKGPSFARVDAVEDHWSEATGEFDGFAVR